MSSDPCLKVLIVDDENSMRNLAIQCLSGHEKRLAANCEEAREVYNRFKPHIVFLDMNLPDGNGLNLLREFLEKKSDTYIVMVTVNRRIQNVTQALELGAKGYVAKPFNKKSLLKHVNSCIQVIGPENLKQEIHTDDPIEIAQESVINDNQDILSLADVHKNWRILFADSIHHNCEAAKRAFQELGCHQVVTVMDGDLAWKLMQQSNFQLVFFETHLPKCNGYDLTQMIRDKQKGEEFQTYIVGMQPEQKSESKKWLYAGMNECITKPFNLSGLQRIADKYANAYYRNYYPLLERLVRANEFDPNASTTIAEYQQRVDEYTQDIADFKQVVGHTLRDPFFDMYGLYDGLRKSEEPITKEALNTLLPPFETLLTRLESLKEYLDLKTFKPKFSIVDMEDVLRDARKSKQPKMQSKKIVIEQANHFPQLIGNKRLLTKLFECVLDNAINFSDAEQRIHIRCAETEEAFIFTIEDEGVGIDPLHTKLVFRPFCRYEDEDENANRSGEGMGLTIAKEIVELHDGKIWLEPLEPRGTTCSFSISKQAQIS